MTPEIDLPAELDPELWFRCAEVPGAKDYLYDSHWHTHPGRMSAWCPSRQVSYRVSATSITGDVPVATRYWIDGFLAGNLPAHPRERDDSPEMREWRAAAAQFAATGQWGIDPPVHHAALTDLRRVTEHHYDGAEAGDDWLVAVVLQFIEGFLVLEADPDSDEVVLRLNDAPTLRHWSGETRARDRLQDAEWSSSSGCDSAWRWQLSNQQGYLDGVQLELAKDGASVTLQWIAAASRLHPSVVRPIVR